MRRTCNRGSTNPEYKSTPQDLPDEKGWRQLRNAGLGESKVRFQQESMFFCIKANNSESLRSMFYFIINHEQYVSDPNLDHITHTTSFLFFDQSSTY
jgi:hypothetical protein